LAALVTLPGCDGGALTAQGKKRAAGGGDEEETPRVELVAQTYGTITGKVVYDGTPPTPQPISMGANEAACHAGAPPQELVDQQWIVSGNGGVANVVVFLQPPPGKFFKLPEEQQKPKEEVVKIHQPRCAFIPRVFVMFPSYYDKESNGQKPTGQKLQVLNDAPFEHNFNLMPNSTDNP